MSPRPAHWIRFAVASGVLAILLVIVYSGIFHAPFAYDDTPSIVDNIQLRQGRTWTDVLTAPPQTTAAGRPLVSLTLALNYAFSGIEVPGYHAFNLAVLFLCALVLYALLELTMRRASFVAQPAAWAAATVLLWTVHPFQAGVITSTVQRAESMAALAALFVLYALARHSGSKRPALWFAAATVASILGALAKETIAVLPLIALLYERFFLASSWKAPFGRRGLLLLSITAGCWIPLLFLIPQAARDQSVGLSFTDMAPWDYLRIQCAVILMYLRLVVLAGPFALTYAGAMPMEWTEWVPHAALLVLLFGWGIHLAIRRHSAGFALVAFFIFLAPSSSFLPIRTEMAALHRMFLPSALLVSLMTATVWRFSSDRIGRIPTIVTIAVAVAVLSVFTWRYTAHFKDPISLWSYTTRVQPGHHRAWSSLGAAYYDAGQYPDAAKSLEQAVYMQPRNFEAWYNLALVRQAQDDWIGAENSIERALEISPNMVPARFNLAYLYFRQKRYSAAEREYREVLRLTPGHHMAWFNLAILRGLAGDYPEAIWMAKQSLAIRPDFVPAQKLLDKFKNLTPR